MVLRLQPARVLPDRRRPTLTDATLLDVSPLYRCDQPDQETVETAAPVIGGGYALVPLICKLARSAAAPTFLGE